MEQFPALNLEGEVELFGRISLLENRMIDGLPPQLSQGEYENLVKNFLRESISLSDYARTLKRELFEILVLELKGDLVEKLSYLLINEPTERYLEIMGHNPPYKEKYITKECLEFVDDFLSRLLF